MINEMLTDFRVSMNKIAAELHEAYQNERLEVVGALAHKLKSSARSVGAMALGEVCEALERMGKNKDIAALTDEMPSFEKHIKQVEAFLADRAVKGDMN